MNRPNETITHEAALGYILERTGTTVVRTLADRYVVEDTAGRGGQQLLLHPQVEEVRRSLGEGLPPPRWAMEPTSVEKPKSSGKYRRRR